MDIPVLFQDDSLIVINKPPNLVVDKSATQTTGTLENILEDDFKIKLERGGIVHRLDKDTSGLLLVAKQKEALETLQLQFKERMVKKEYLALVHGVITEGGVVSGAIARNPKNREKFAIFDDGKQAQTRYEPVGNYQFSINNYQSIFNDLNKNEKKKLERSNYGKFTLLRCFPQTGRTHQIRVHLKYTGHPIVGDEKYAGRKTSRLDKLWCKRQFLHAAKLQFYHPVSGERMEFESELPEDLKKVIDVLEVGS